MANSDSPFGLKPLRKLGSGVHNGGLERVFFAAGDATATFIGDPIKIAGSADADGVPTVAQAAATNAIYGVIVGFEPNRDDLSVVHRVASTARYGFAVTDPNMEFEIQEDAVGGALAAADIGLNANIIVGAGDTATGLSGVELDTNTKATTATLPLKILRLVPREDNEFAANSKVIVKINNHQLGSHTGTAGV